MVKRSKPLVIGSDSEDRVSLRQALKDAQCVTPTFIGASDALDKLRDVPFDLVIVAQEPDDESSSLRVAQAVKWRWPGTPVIILAENQSSDALRAALNLGVDAYLLKPVEEVELQAVVQRVLKLRQHVESVEESSGVLRWRGLALHMQNGDVTLDGKPVHLTPTEFKLLRYLMENGHRVVSPEDLYEASHGHPPYDLARAGDAIRWHVHNLRQKLEPDPGRPIYVLNVYGLGYTFAGTDV